MHKFGAPSRINLQQYRKVKVINKYGEKRLETYEKLLLLSPCVM
jgi:hypothetical protein